MTGRPMPPVDLEALNATLDLIDRTGATSVTVGYLHDDVPVDQAAWWAHAQYRGARIAVEDHVGPLEAYEALARRLLAGARCRWCGLRITTGSARARGRCLWTRTGARWSRGCEPTLDGRPTLPIPPWARGGDR